MRQSTIDMVKELENATAAYEEAANGSDRQLENAMGDWMCDIRCLVAIRLREDEVEAFEKQLEEDRSWHFPTQADIDAELA